MSSEKPLATARITSPTKFTSPTANNPPWHAYLNIDTILLVFSRTIFHWFFVLMLPLSARALEAPYDSSLFIATAFYAALINIYHLLSAVSHRYAYGPPREVDLSDEVVVITGGKGGLGGCIAEVYGMKGVRVAVLDINVDEEEERLGAAEESDVRYYKCDVGNGASVESVWKRVVEDLGTPTILVNNAAVVTAKPFLDLSPEDVERTFRINTLSHYRLTSLFLPPLLQCPNGGTVVSVASVLGYHTSLRAELASSSMPENNIKTILVAPGQLSTPLFDGLQQNRIRDFIGPLVDVRELAMKIMFMIDHGEGGVIAAPAYAKQIAWLGVLPAGLQKLARWGSGVESAMQAMLQRRAQSDMKQTNRPVE